MDGPGPLFKKNRDILSSLSGRGPMPRDVALSVLGDAEAKQSAVTVIVRRAKGRAGRRSWSRIREADAWLQLACRRFYKRGPALERAGLIVRTETGFDWRASGAALAITLGSFAFQEWKRLDVYFTISGKPANGEAIKRQYLRICKDFSRVRDLHRVKAVITELN